MPLLDLCLPALELLTKEQYLNFRDVCYKLAHADQKIDIYEYTLHTILLRHFDRTYLHTKPKVKKKSIASISKPTSDLVLALAILGNSDDFEKAQLAYTSGIDHLGLPVQLQQDFSNLPEVDLDFIDSAIKELNNISYPIKESIIRACISAISSDKEINHREYSLIRAIADSFDCPVPYLTA